MKEILINLKLWLKNNISQPNPPKSYKFWRVIFFVFNRILIEILSLLICYRVIKEGFLFLHTDSNETF
jgi:hypothetical protein